MLYGFDELDLYISLVTLAVFLVILLFRKRSFSSLLCCFIFGVYLIGVMSVVVFPIFIPGPDLIDQQGIMWQNINLVPFNFGKCSIMYICDEQIKQMIQNIILTIPFGFGLNFLVRLKARDFIWLPFAVGLGFEMTQFVVSQGLAHALDIDDVILNAAGVFVGYGCFRVFGWFYIIAMQFFKIKPRWLFAYIYEVVSQAV
jgi:glycopeptide antibiotics resistance protein